MMRIKALILCAFLQCARNPANASIGDVEACSAGEDACARHGKSMMQISSLYASASPQKELGDPVLPVMHKAVSQQFPRRDYLSQELEKTIHAGTAKTMDEARWLASLMMQKGAGEDSSVLSDGENVAAYESFVNCLPDERGAGELDFDIQEFSTRARGRACMFSNLYRDQDGFLLLFVSGSVRHSKLITAEKQYCVAVHPRLSIECPRVQVYGTYEALKSDVLKRREAMYHRYYADLTLHFLWACGLNPAHSLWDDIYPVYVSLNRFGLENNTFLPYMDTKTGDCGWALYPGPESINTNPKSGDIVHIRIADRSKMEPYDLPSNLNPVSSMIWRSWVSLNSFGWREAAFVERFNQSHSVIDVTCDHESLLVSDAQACDESLRSGQETFRLHLKVPSQWLRVARNRTHLPMEQVMADFGAQRPNAESLNHAELDHHVASPYLLQFETIVMGTSSGNMLLTPEAAIEGSRAPHWAMRKFRDRMLDAHRVARRSSARVADDSHSLRALFILNKRFDAKDVQQINAGIEVLKATGSIDTNSALINYQSYPSFQEQLKLVHDSDIYVSGPGTGMLNAPFLPDGAAVVNLGSWAAIHGSIIPFFMEQQTVGGGTPYLHVLFRNFSESSHAFHDRPRSAPNPQGDIIGSALDSTDIAELVWKAKDRMIHGTISTWEDNGNIEDNLSPEGVAFREYCMLEPQKCFQVLRARAFGPCQTTPEMWYENMVYEVEAPYDVCALNHTLISRLRQKHGLYQYGQPARFGMPDGSATKVWNGSPVFELSYTPEGQMASTTAWQDSQTVGTLRQFLVISMVFAIALVIAMGGLGGGSLLSKCPLPISIGLWACSSIGMNIVNKLALAVLPFPLILLLVQLIIAVILLLAFFSGRVLMAEIVNKRRNAWKWGLLTLPFTGMLVSSLLAVQKGGVTLVVVSRNLLPLVSLFAERVLLPNTARPITVQATLALIAIAMGSLGYAYACYASQESHAVTAVMWLGVNMFMTIAHRFLEKHLLVDSSMDLSFAAMSLLNSTVPALPILIGIACGGDLSKWLSSPTQQHQSMQNRYSIVVVFMSGFLGLSLGYWSIVVQKAVSATSMLTMQTTSKVLTILLAMIMFKEHCNLLAGLCIVVSLAASVWYSATDIMLSATTLRNGQNN